ncbi:MAG TPA: type II CAAX endopeptidase family protein [Candidatus Dormibacteraeota bacterium]|nr:type II CAAX endopeptidase family protein [Candidatus Dormibacteraeota bacterium]
MNDRPAWPAPPTSAAPAPWLAPPGPEVDPLSRYRALQVVSILLIAGGLLTTAVVVGLNLDLFSSPDVLDPTSLGRAVNVLVALVLGGLAMVVGLVMNAVRAVIVRAALPPERYRGPSIIVLLLIATVIAGAASVAAAPSVAGLLGEGGQVSVLGTLVLLTATQVGLLAAVGAFVAVPGALANVRLLPERALWRSMLLGLGLAIPAWLGTQAVLLIVVWLLGLIGLQPDLGIAEAALANADPIVLIVALVVVAPVAEETFFRGVAYNAWEREYGPRRALVGSAVLFAVTHGSLFLFLPILGLGLALVLVYRATRSLPAAILLHAGFNGISVAIGLLVRFDVIRLPT